MRAGVLTLLVLCAGLAGPAMEWEQSTLPRERVPDAPFGFALNANGGAEFAHTGELRQKVYLTVRSGDGWSEDVIAQMEGFGAQAAITLDLAMDSRGRRHVAHGFSRAYQPVQLEYLTDRLGGWTRKPVGEPRPLGAEAAIAVDVAGGPHIACRSREPEDDLFYVHRPAGRWEIVPLDEEGRVGYSLDLAMAGPFRPPTRPDQAEMKLGPRQTLGRNYKAYVAHLEMDRRGKTPTAVHLRYISDRGHWTDDTLPVPTGAGRGLSLAVSTWEEPHVAMGAGRALLHGEKLSGATEGLLAAWRIETVVTTEGDVEWTDTVLDGEHQPWIAFAAADGVFLAHRVKGEWKVERVARSEAHRVRLALDPWGGIHIGWWDATTRQLRYARGKRE